MPLKQYIDDHREVFIEDLKELLKIDSVSSDSTRKDKMQACAEKVESLIREAGLEDVRIMPTQGHPIVFAQSKQDADKPTILIYGHYDVQPEDPVDKWDTPPFEPTIKGSKIFARGATDDKGQFLVHIQAVRALLSQDKELPVNVKFCIEGEEEVGSPSLVPFLNEHQELLSADILVVSDSAMYAEGLPSIVYGLRGLAYLEVEVFGANSDLHSGVFGGAVPNPANELAKIIAQLKDDNGTIQIPGFYDDVLELTPQEREAFAKLPFDQEQWRANLEVPGLDGEKEYSVLERRWARPTFDVNGLLSGFTGEGAKTVLPNYAMAKISFRLVPNQDPDKIAQLVQDHIQSLCPDTLTCKVNPHHGGHPWLTPIDHPSLEAAKRALKKAFGTEPATVREGGSIPIVADFQKILGVPGILVGFGLNDENLHAPNEHFDLNNFMLGIHTSALLLKELEDYKV